MALQPVQEKVSKKKSNLELRKQKSKGEYAPPPLISKPIEQSSVEQKFQSPNFSFGDSYKNGYSDNKTIA